MLINKKNIIIIIAVLFLFFGLCPAVSAQEKSNLGLGLDLSAASAWHSIKNTFSALLSETTTRFLVFFGHKKPTAAIAVSLNSPTITNGNTFTALGNGLIKYLSDGTLAIYSNNQATQQFCFPQSAAYTIKITAWGTYAGNAWPNMRLLIDNQTKADITIDSSVPKTFSVITNLTSGCHWLTIAFTNDYHKSFKRDRNLFVDQLEIVAPTTPTDLPIPLTGSLIIEAENFSNYGDPLFIEKLNDGTLCIYSNNQISQKINFVQSGAYTFKITARGSYAGGAWPNLRLLIDNQSKADFVVDSPTVKTFSAVTEITAGSHWLAIAFTNDYYVPMKEDRNLYVDKVEISKQIVSDLGCGNDICETGENKTSCQQDCGGCYEIIPFLFYPNDYKTNLEAENYVKNITKETHDFFEKYVGKDFIMDGLTIIHGDGSTADYWNDRFASGGFLNNVWYEIQKKGYSLEAIPFKIRWVFMMGGGGWAGGAQFSNKYGYAGIGDVVIWPTLYPECKNNCQCSYFSLLKKAGPNGTDLTPPDWACNDNPAAAVHELGHAFGLPHPDGYTTWTKNGLPITKEAAWGQSIMGYADNFPDKGLLDEDINLLKNNFNACSAATLR